MSIAWVEFCQSVVVYQSNVLLLNPHRKIAKMLFPIAVCQQTVVTVFTTRTTVVSEGFGTYNRSA